MKKKKQQSLCARIFQRILEKWKKIVPIVIGFLGFLGGILGFRDDIGDLLEFLKIINVSSSNTCYFSGSVVDEQCKPLPDVLFNIEGGLGSGSTDASGNFRFKVKAQRGDKIRLTCTKPGYQIYDNYFVLPGPAKILLKKEKKKW